MATTTHHAALATRSTFADRFGTLLRDLRTAYEESKLVRRTERELSELNDRDLPELVFSRFDISRIARESARSV
ncbi:MAG: DUF1127 domain-containing protein [Rhodobacteraceae bacterium]|nr:DUF1127 domain-containing protein [Paracoccaceae bacterium]